MVRINRRHWFTPWSLERINIGGDPCGGLCVRSRRRSIVVHCHAGNPRSLQIVPFIHYVSDYRALEDIGYDDHYTMENCTEQLIVHAKKESRLLVRDHERYLIASNTPNRFPAAWPFGISTATSLT